MVYLGSETVCPEKDRQAVFIHPCIFTIIIHVRIFGQTNQTMYHSVFRGEASVLFHLPSLCLSLWYSIWFTWEMSPSSIFSRGSLSPFVFWPSKISLSRQNQVTVLSWKLKIVRKYPEHSRLFQLFHLFSSCWRACYAWSLCHLISWLPLRDEHEHGVDHGVAEPGRQTILVLKFDQAASSRSTSSQHQDSHLNAAEAKLLMMSGWTPALYSVASSTRRPYLAEMGLATLITMITTSVLRVTLWWGEWGFTRSGRKWVKCWSQK